MDEKETLVVLALNVELVQVALFKETLEENGIQCFVTENNSPYGARGEMYLLRGIGKRTIRVRKSDEERAIKVLSDLGYPVFNEDDEEQNFLKKLASPTEKIPVLAKYSLNTRLSIMAIIITAVITVIVFCFKWAS